MEPILQESIEFVANQVKDEGVAPSVTQENHRVANEFVAPNEETSLAEPKKLQQVCNDLLSDIEAYMCNNDEQLHMIRKKVEELRKTLLHSTHL